MLPLGFFNFFTLVLMPLLRVRWRPFSLIAAEVDPGAITLSRPIDVLKPAEMLLKLSCDSKDTWRHRAVVIADLNEAQRIARRQAGLIAHGRGTWRRARM